MTITQYGPGDEITWGAALWPGDPRIDGDADYDDDDDEDEQ